MDMNLPNLATWTSAVSLMQQGYHHDLIRKVDHLRLERTVYPPQGCVMRALEATSFDRVKVVIVGQDPYHGEGQADGLAFSVPDGVPVPPSLRNIFREISDDVYGGSPPDFSTDLERWAVQGVLLLNASLTVEAGQAGSHRDLGWITLTGDVISCLNAERDHLVFMLWGRFAHSKRSLIDAGRHLILEAPHPSPLSAYRGFFGCQHFSRANAYLSEHGEAAITW